MNQYFIPPREVRAKITLDRFLYRIEEVKSREEARLLRWLKRGGRKADAGEYTSALYYLNKCVEIGGNICIVVVAEIYRDACLAAIDIPVADDAFWVFQDSLWEFSSGDRIPTECRL